ncbi:MAG TPA: threonine synthase [Flavobacteriaceae bacterium]|nr:threonine synthase [Flavobacteriaceae bacterium]HAT65910.1 threonine synthase [Flavobacteriaceae bacterium]|tara:strand:- start:55935 stop:57230 length:1296 start_codon:yes stop_codon:yes gene_type:complete
MQYFSLNHKAPNVSFREAVLHGLAADKGLYFPSEITPLPKTFFDTIEEKDTTSIAFEAIKQFVGADIPKEALQQIVNETLSFDFPLVKIEDNVAALELFHGPTLAFKDVGARFMARCLGYFNQNNEEKITVLVATSGDTGGAVANGFFKVPGVEVVILYPKGKVSEIQEKQLTTYGENITAIEVDGVFDDCQAMVKEAFLDKDFEGKRKLTSANSINVARWIPQMFYYFLVYKKLKNLDQKLIFSVPSGNYGNICAGMLAQKLGLPIHHFVAGTNANDIVPAYLQSGKYITKPSVATISNAMDVGAPSNFIRIEALHNNSFKTLSENLSGYSFTDDETREAMKSLYERHNYIADPHGAVGYLALKEYLKEHPNKLGIFLETAHPVKFLDVIPKKLVARIEMPESIKQILQKKKKAETILTYSQLKSKLLLN